VINDRKYRQQKARVDALAEKWKRISGFGTWDIKIDYHREGLRASDAEYERGEETAFRITVTPHYLQMLICVSIPTVAELDDEDLEICFLHELGHVFVEELLCWDDEKRPDDKRVERVCTMIGKALYWAWHNGKADRETNKEAGG
jgi:hypothetical protein